MPDERDELTPAQQALAAAHELTEALQDLLTMAQVPDMLDRQVLAFRAAHEPNDEPPFAEVFDKLSSAICDLDHLAGQPACLDRLRDAAQRWVRGED